jgi:hypothetical protein
VKRSRRVSVLSGQRLGLRRRNHHRTPEVSTDADRNSDGRTDPQPLNELGDLALEPGVVVYASRPAALAYAGDDALAVERPARADREEPPSLREVADFGGGVVGLVAHDAHERHVNDATDFLRDDFEESVRRPALRHQCRHAPERCLFLGEHA